MTLEVEKRTGLSAPPLAHPARGIFESAMRGGNTALEHLSRLDYWIEQCMHKDGIDLNIYDILATQVEDARSAVDRARRSNILRPQHIYRLITATKTLEEMVFVPRIFHDTNSTELERNETTQHLAGTHVGILEDLLNEQRSAVLQNDRTDYTGMVSEQTFLAAINATYDPNMAAIQSLIHEDLRAATDAWVYLRDGETCYTVPVQVKTSMHHIQPSKKVLHIPMGEYNRDQHLAKSLISLMNGEEMDEKARESLDNLVSFIKRNGPAISQQYMG